MSKQINLQQVQSRQVQSLQGLTIRSLFAFLVLFGYFGTHVGTHRVTAQTVSPGITSANDGTNTQIRSQGNIIHIEGGTTAGNNLFQSFGQFGVNAGQTANFQSTPNIQNILGRVTGGNASVINGQLQVTGSNANLFLINPAGMIFGPNAQLNLPAAFTATTANSVRFGNDQWFNSIGSNAYNSLVGNPTDYAFAAGPGGTILNSGNLSATNLTLLGGTVVNTGTLTSKDGGTLTLQAVPGGKLVRITESNALLSLDLPLDNPAIPTSTTAPRSLPQLLTGGNIPEVQGITVRDGIVYLSATQTPIATTPGAATIAGNLSANGSTNGGRILINGEKTYVAANLSATGGTGKGGFIDTSGKSLTIAPTTRVNTLSKTGTAGTWLLDPINLEVIATGGSSSADSIVDSTTLRTNLASSDITLQADRNITISTFIGSASGRRLTLDAPTIDLNAPIFVGAGNLFGTATTVNVGANGTIHNAVAVAANNALVTLSPTTYTLQPETGQAEVILSRPITIQGTTQGLNQTTIDSGNNVESFSRIRLFTVENTATLRDLTLQNGFSNTVGGAIYNDGTLTLDRVTLQDNIARTDGGALYNTFGSVANINNSTFTNNTASRHGGAINNNGRLTLDRVTLENNRADEDGGAISNEEDSVANINNSTFKNNAASINGGAIYNDGTLTLDRVTLENNSADRNGGALYNDSLGDSVINNSTLKNNTASENGGATYNIGALTLDRVTLENNSAGNDGGALYNNAEDSDDEEFSVATINNSTFKNNIATDDGGAIANNGTLTILNSTLSGNISEGASSPVSGGGAILNTTKATLTIRNSTLSGNRAKVGGAIRNDGRLTLDSDTITDNSATRSGGGVVNSVNPAELVALISNPTTIAQILADPAIITLLANNTDIAVSLAIVRLNPNTTNVANFATLVASKPDVVNQFINNPTIANLINNSEISIQGRTSLRNTIVAQNFAPIAPDATGNIGSFTDEGHNLIGISQGFNSPIASTTLFGTVANPLDPDLAPLGNYGGLTETHALHLGSAALNTGLTTLTTDQRGKARSGLIDIGAFESSGFRLKAGSGNKLDTVVNTAFQPLNVQVEAIDPLEPITSPDGGTIALTVTPTPGSNNARFINTTPQTIEIDEEGKGVITGNANQVAGRHSISGTAVGLEGSANFNLLNLPDVAANITALNGSGQKTNVNTGFKQNLEAKVTDQFGNVIANTAVSFTLPGSGPSATANTLVARTNEQGIAILPITANGLDGTFTVIGTVNGITSTAQFTLTNQPIATPSTGTNNLKASENQGQELQRSSAQKNTPIQPNSTQTTILCVINNRNEKTQPDRQNSPLPELQKACENNDSER